MISALAARTRSGHFLGAMALAAAFLAAPLVVPAGAPFGPAALGAERPLAERPVPVIRVAGLGEAKLSPDMAIVSMAVRREAETAREALTANNEAMAATIAAMKAAGVSDKDLQTSGFSIQPRWFYPRNNKSNGGSDEEPRIVGYTVTNQLTMRVRDLSKLGELLDKSVTLGVNQGGNVRFANDDPASALAEARAAAMRDARKRAETLAEAAGVALGPVLEISENATRPQAVPIARARTMEMAADASASVPVEAGENSYKVTVQAVWEISQ